MRHRKDKSLLNPPLMLFFELLRKAFVEQVVVVVEQHRDLAAVAVIFIAIPRVKPPDPIGRFDLSVFRGVPPDLPALSCLTPDLKGSGLAYQPTHSSHMNFNALAGA
ncbi:hypothetical protein VWS93_002647 [Cronobacter sakazakii]|nr:hypothetical protein [Cronobacter sakazakii]